MFWNPQLKTFFRFLETNQKEEPKDTTTAATTGWQTEKQPDEESTAPETEQKDESSTSGTSIKINNKKLYSNKL